MLEAESHGQGRELVLKSTEGRTNTLLLLILFMAFVDSKKNLKQQQAFYTLTSKLEQWYSALKYYASQALDQRK